MTVFGGKLNKKVTSMLIITFIKPNVIIDSDTMISGNIRICDKEKHELWSQSVDHRSFISIRTGSSWPRKLSVEVNTGNRKIRKELLT